MNIPPRFIIHETAHWILNHHMGSALPGYLMLGSKVPVQSLSDLPADALAELGGLLARASSSPPQHSLRCRSWLASDGDVSMYISIPAETLPPL